MQQRTQSCVRTAGDIVSTALGIIQYWEGTPPRVLISVLLIQNIPRKKIYIVSRNILSQNIPRKKNQNAPPSEIAYATLWDSGVDYLPPARWPVGRTLCVCEFSREQSCVRTAGDIVSTALGIIQYWEGTPPRVLISVLLIQNIPPKKNL